MEILLYPFTESGEHRIQKVADIIVIMLSMKAPHLFTVAIHRHNRDSLYMAGGNDILVGINVHIANQEAVRKLLLQGFFQNRMQCLTVYTALCTKQASPAASIPYPSTPPCR